MLTMKRACICGVRGCTRHGRRTPSATDKARGADHQHRRKVMLASITPDTRCWRCGGLARDGDPWEAGHTHDLALGGGPEVRPEHRSCNRRAGGELGVQLRGVKPPGDNRRINPVLG